MTRQPARSAEPRHSRGGAGGAAGADAEPWYGQKVKVPRRVWGSGRYSPGAVAWHAQITALQKRPERCRASVARLAGWMGDSKRTGERYLAELHAPGPDGVPELTTIRHTDSAGDGETAERWTRSLARDEHFAYVPVLAAKTLRHRLFVLYCALAYAVATRTPATAVDLAGVLGVTEMTARRMTTELEGLGWITVHRRAGAHGRHDYEVHDGPLHAVPAPAAVSSDGGSGASAGGGSLATKEDAVLTDQRNNPPTAVLGIRRRRPTATSACERDLVVDTFGRRTGLDLTAAAWKTVHAVLAPVRHELPRLTGWEWERAVHEVLRHLGDGQHPDRLRDRLQRRYPQMRSAGTPDDGRPAVRSFARWLIGAALVRRGCADPRCETGVIWSADPDDHQAGTDCQTCAYAREAATAHRQLLREIEESERRVAARRAQKRPHTPPQAPPAPEPAPGSPHAPQAPPHAPTGPVGPPPGTGGWRALVARERPHAAAQAYQHRWTGDHAEHIRPARDTA
ncbi:hypothetical protein AB0N31_10555 [Streptomyces sp. NPDC051051]|uniref:hypothetical protein n=1 Tax=Streptomyces sp. NPDC051051 TaxID=3155666 RepID=UPI00342F711F